LGASRRTDGQGQRFAHTPLVHASHRE
jgi:hypothetical protein